MKCQDCREYIGEICQLAQEGKISEIDSPTCLARVQIILLRDILEALYEDEPGF